MGRLEIPALALTALFVLMSFNPISGDVGGNAPTVNANYTFSYHLQSMDGTSSKDGTLTATLTEVTWNSVPAYLFQGSLSGTYQTTAGSGTESGTWKEHYRKTDLSFMDHNEVIDTIVSGYTVTNSTTISYGTPLQWRRPLTVLTPPTHQDEVDVLSTWARKINGEDDTSGSDFATWNYSWIIPAKVDITVGAGTFSTYKIREHITNDPEDQMTDYYYNETVGWWVRKDVYLDNQDGDPVLIKQYELEDLSLNEPPVKNGNPKVSMNEDTTDRSLDLDSIFSDPESDPLTFAIVDEGLFEVTIESGNKVAVTSSPNYFGSGDVIVSAQDPTHPPVMATIPVTVKAVDDPPFLSAPELSPTSGDESTLFTYSITSTDIDTLDASSAEIRIDSSTFDLTKISGNNETGILYRYSTNLDPGSHTYSFMIDGVRHPATGDLNGPTVIARDTPFLKEGSVSPGQGDVNSLFTFKVTWVGPNGEEPDALSIVLDGTDISLTDQEGDPATGILFSDSRKLSEGDHSFHFEAEQGSDVYRFPQSGNLNGPTVAGLADPYLRNGKVDPDDGGLSTDFTFEVTWIGPNGEVPIEVLLVLDDVEMPITKEGGTSKTGIIYSDTIGLEEGEHSFHYEATYGSEFFRLPRSGEIQGPIVKAPEIGECGYFHVEDNEDTATYEFYANYRYVINVDPDSVVVLINGQGYDLSDYSGSPTMGMNYTRRVPLGEGTYTVMMRIVSEGVTLEAACDNLKVDLPDDNPDEDPKNQTTVDENGNDTLVLIVAALIIIVIVAVIIFLLFRRKGPQDVWSEPEKEYPPRRTRFGER